MKKLFAAAALAALAVSPICAAKDKKGDAAAGAAVPSLTATGKFVESAATGLAGNKRVAISQVMLIFQTSAAGTSDKNWLLGQFAPNPENANALLEFTSLHPKTVDAIAGFIGSQLRQDLIANGFEVVPEETVKASATFKEMIKTAGVTRPSRFANKLGDAWYSSYANLDMYMPYSMEVGTFQVQMNSFMGWTKGGKIMAGRDSTTPGGPNSMKIDNNWKLPGLEVKLAKELGAHVVKATYVVTLGSIQGAKMKDGESSTKALVMLGMMQDQTRISFRTANGKNFHLRSMTKQVPAKDGDVVVTLANPLFDGVDHFNLSGAVEPKPGGGQWHVGHATLKNELSYIEAVVKLAKKVDDALLPMVKQ